MGLIHQKQVPLARLPLVKIPLQLYIGIKDIIVIAYDAVHPVADIQTEFKGTYLKSFGILQHLVPGDAVHLLDDFVDSVIDPVVVALGPGTCLGIAVRLFHDAELFLCCDGNRIKIEIPLPP